MGSYLGLLHKTAGNIFIRKGPLYVFPTLPFSNSKLTIDGEPGKLPSWLPSVCFWGTRQAPWRELALQRWAAGTGESAESNPKRFFWFSKCIAKCPWLLLSVACFVMCLIQESVNYGLVYQLLTVVNKVLLEVSHDHLFPYCLWLSSHSTSRMGDPRQRGKYLLCDPVRNILSSLHVIL